MPVDEVDTLESIARSAERRNRGWIYAGDVPPCVVHVNGAEVQNVTAVHQRKGKAVVMVTDHTGKLVIDKHKKRFLTKTLYGAIELRWPKPSEGECDEY